MTVPTMKISEVRIIGKTFRDVLFFADCLYSFKEYTKTSVVSPSSTPSIEY